MLFLSVVFPVLLSAFLTVTLNGCGVEQKLDDMHDATNDLKQTSSGIGKSSEHLDSTTSHLDQTTNGMATTTNYMLDALIHNDSKNTREESLKRMSQSSGMTGKLEEGVAYFCATEVQYWRESNPGGLAKRADMAKWSAQEFYQKIHEFMPNDPKFAPEPLIDLSPPVSADANRMADLDALAATMHFADPSQTAILAQNKSLPELNMLTMTETALRARVAIAAGRSQLSDYPAFVPAIINEWSGAALKLLQVRHNAIVGIVIGMVSEIEKKGTLGGMMMACQKWRARLDHFDQGGLDLILERLQGARKTREFLASVGEAPTVDYALRAIVQNITPPSRSLAELDAMSGQRRFTEKEIMDEAVAIGKIQETSGSETVLEFMKTAGICRDSPARATAHMID